MEKDKISIIICTYNTEKYISKCLDSLIEQSYSNLEIIIIDDGSKDQTKKILETYQKKDQRISLHYNKENKGLAYSRNVGLKKSTGDYIGFIDSDDYIDINYYEELHRALKKNQADIAVCDIKSVYEANNTVLTIEGCKGDPSKTLSYINVGLAASACNKLFKKELFENTTFDVGKVNEDVAVIIPIMVKSKKITYVKDVYYYYIQRENSIQNSEFSEKRFDIFSGVEHTLEKIKEYDTLEEYKNALIFNQIILLFLYQIIPIKDFKKRLYYLRKFYQYAKPYQINTNPFFQEFLKQTGRKTSYYYRFVVACECHKLFFIENIMIEGYQTIKQKFQTIPLLNPTEKQILELARKNANQKDQNLKISVVIPNYNYEKFLSQRIASILNQTVKISEIILLDDCSKDQSIQVLDTLEKCISPYIPVKKIYNKKNSGTPFAQWQKGMDFATGDYVWICEADDYCHKKMLKDLIKPIQKNPDIVISYCDTAMIDTTGNMIMSSIKKEIDQQNSKHWNQNYVIDGLEEIQKYAYLNCTIANVSSALIKRGDYKDFFASSKKYRQAGDWLFYVQLMKLGKVAYNKNARNYYRIHGSNVTSVTKKQAHLEEIKSIHQEIQQMYGYNDTQKKAIEKRYEYLKRIWDLPNS